MEIVSQIVERVRTHWLYILVVSVPLVAIFIVSDQARMRAVEIWAADPSGTNVANYGVFRFFLFVIQLFMSAVFARLIMRVFVGQPMALWGFDHLFNRHVVKFFAVFLLLLLSVFGFVILVVPPFVHLAYIMDMTPTMARVVLIICGGPLLVWGITFALRTLLILPADANDNSLTMRQALNQTQEQYWNIAKIALMGIIVFWLVTLLPIWNMTRFDLITALIRAVFKISGLVVLSALLASIYGSMEPKST